MKRSNVAKMKEYFEEMDTIEGMETTYTDATDYPEDVPLIEEFQEEEVTEEEEYTDEELEMFLENVNFEESKGSLSFDEMMPQIAPHRGIPYQRKEKVVTPHLLILRENVKRTPSVCPYRDCMYDGAQAIGCKNWDNMPVNKRKIALAALEKHTQIKHKFVDSDIIDESQIPKSWLSPTIL